MSERARHPYQPSVPRSERYYVPVGRAQTQYDRNFKALSQILHLTPAETKSYVTRKAEGYNPADLEEVIQVELNLSRAVRASANLFLRDWQNPPTEIVDEKTAANLKATEQHLRTFFSVILQSRRLSPQLFGTLLESVHDKPSK